MTDDRWMCVPLPWRWLIPLAGALVPGAIRKGWLAARKSAFGAWWDLVERGEIVARVREAGAALCRHALWDALRLRIPPVRMRTGIRHAALVPVATAALAAVCAAATGGFAGARWLAGAARTTVRSTRGEDALAGAGFLLGFATLVGVALLIHAHPGWARRSGRGWAFLAFKIAAVVTLVPLVWFEAVYAGRSYLTAGLPALAAALGFAALLIGGLGGGLWWCFDDQRRRCPECLDLLALPVRLGVWSSVLEPVSTEMVCPRGHGALTVPESGISARDHWTAMDESWRSLFGAAR